jgi:predicted ATPase
MASVDGTDSGAAAAYLAQIKWYLGEVGRAVELIEKSSALAVESGHAPTLALIYHLRGLFEIQRGDATAALRASEALADLCRQHPMALYAAFGSVHAVWARAQLGDGKVGATELKQAIAAFTNQGNKLYLPFYQCLLAEIAAEAEGADAAVARIDGALALARETGEHWSDSHLHHIRGEILLKREPANAAAAEKAFLAAIAVAQQQKARSCELRAALSLAQLYQGTNRAAGAQAVLAPAFAGLSPTPEFPEITKAQTLLVALAL